MSDFRYSRNELFPPVIKNLLIVNFLVWIAQITVRSHFPLTETLSLQPILPARLEQILAQSGELADIRKFNPYQLLTYMFAHASVDSSGQVVFAHILFNMFGLWMFGRTLENLWGPKRFLFFYIASGIGAALLHLGIQYFRAGQLADAAMAHDMARVQSLQGAFAPMLGASGAIMGVMVAFGYLFPNTEFMMIPIPIPVKAKWLVLAYVVLDLFGGITNYSTDNVAHFAHLGGALAGFIIVYIWNKTNRRSLY
ncbi:MAG: rhomboid family intramembrane serine protease [Bacteroidota bacterium]